MDRTLPEDRRRTWVWWTLLAAVASGAHVVIDFAADVYPNTPLGFILIGGFAVALYAFWAVAAVRAARGVRSGVIAAQWIALVWAGVGNGLVGMVACPPVALLGGESPCPFSPWQDFAHLGSLVGGFAAFWLLRSVATVPARPGAGDKMTGVDAPGR